MNALSIFRWLEGTWSLSRQITGTGKMNGKAVFRLENPINLNRYHYREEGILTFLTNQSLNFHREYVYEYDENHQIINVYFNENPLKFFHKLQFSTDFKSADASHLCINDRYDAYYTFLNENQFGLQYRVKGPKKDYQIISTFTKEN